MFTDSTPLPETYVTKNKYFDKDPVSRIEFYPLLGESIVTHPSNDVWARKRKLLSTAFYKEKLIKMTDSIKEVVIQKIEEMERDYAETGKAFDLVKEIGDLHMRIIMVSVFGIRDLHKIKLPYLRNG